MKFARYLLFATMVLVICFVSSALAQGGGRAWRFYDPSTETTVQGSVEKVMEVTGRQDWNGTHLTLGAGNQKYDVHVGPSDYISKNSFMFSAGDQIEVTGSKVKVGGTDTMIAREIKRGDKVLTLRNSQGIPAWSGGRRRY